MWWAVVGRTEGLRTYVPWALPRPRGTFRLLTALFSFIYALIWDPAHPCARVCILWSPYTAPASRNRWAMSARQLSQSAALTRATPILPLLAELVRRSCAGGGAPLWAGCVRSSAVRRQREARRRQPLENGRERPQTLWASGARRARGDGRGRPRVCPVLWSQGFPIKATAAEIGSVPICFSGTRLCRPRPCSRLTCWPDAARRRGQRVCCSRASCSASAAQACLAALHRPYPATWRPPYVPSASFLPPRTKLLSQQAPAAQQPPRTQTACLRGQTRPCPPAQPTDKPKPQWTNCVRHPYALARRACFQRPYRLLAHTKLSPSPHRPTPRTRRLPNSTTALGSIARSSSLHQHIQFRPLDRSPSQPSQSDAPPPPPPPDSRRSPITPPARRAPLRNHTASARPVISSPTAHFPIHALAVRPVRRITNPTAPLAA